MTLLVGALTVASLSLGVLALLFKLLYFAISKTFKEDVCAKTHIEMATKNDLFNMKTINDVMFTKIEDTYNEIKQDLREIKHELMSKKEH